MQKNNLLNEAVIAEAISAAGNSFVIMNGKAADLNIFTYIIMMTKPGMYLKEH